MTIEERKNEMYRAFEMYLSNEINDAQLVNKLKRVLGEKKWFRYFKGDAFANDYRSVSRALSSKLNNQYERESMELSLEDRELQIYDSMSGNQLYAKGGLVKKSDFTMLGAGLLIGGLFAYFKK